MDKRGAKGYWISTAKVINQEIFDEYVNKVGPWLKEVGGEVFAKDNEPKGKERTEDANLAVICEFPSMRELLKRMNQNHIKNFQRLDMRLLKI